MRAFTTHTAAVALDLDSKWLDNLLTHHDIDGCTRVRQGIGRRLTERGVLHVAVIADLSRTLGIPVRIACGIAGSLLTSVPQVNAGPAGVAVLAVTSTLVLRLDIEAIEVSVAARLALAVETARRPRRGRPPNSLSTTRLR